MDMSQQERLNAVASFNEFLTDHGRQTQMLLDGKNGEEVIDLISEISRMTAKSVLKARLSKKDGKEERDAAGLIVSNAEQVSRMSHRLGVIYGEFWTDQGMALFKILSGLEVETMFRVLATVEAGDDGSANVVKQPGVTDAELEDARVKSEIEGVVKAFKELGIDKLKNLKTAAIARPAQPIMELISILENVKGRSKSFEQHQMDTAEFPPFADTDAKRFAFTLVTYLVNSITAGIAFEDTISASTIGAMAFTRSCANMLLHSITPLPKQAEYNELVRLVSNGTFEDFESTFRVRKSGNLVREALKKVESGEMTSEELKALYKELEINPPAEHEETEGKFVFSAPASVQ